MISKSLRDKDDLNLENIRLVDIIDLDHIQQLQDLFSEANGVASVVTDISGNPITQPSNFCSLCNKISINRNKKHSCFSILAEEMKANSEENRPVLLICMNGMLHEAGAKITVSGKHIANWFIGQVKKENYDEALAFKYTQEYGITREEFYDGIKELPVMSDNQFSKIVKVLLAFATQISEKAYDNLQLRMQIAEHNNLMQQLKFSEERLSFSLLATNDGLWDWDLITHKAYFSPQYYLMLGYEPNEFEASYENWKKLVHPGDLLFCEEALQDAIIQGLDFNIEFRALTKDGNVKWILVRGKVMERDEYGNPKRMVGTHVDITAQKLAEEALRESEERNRLLADLTMEGILIHRNAIARDVNQALTKVMGYEREELINHNFFEFVFPQDIEIVKQNIAREYAKPYEIRMVRKNGEIFYAEIEAKDFINQGEKWRVAAVRDVTERKRAERLLKEKSEEIEAQNEEYLQINEELMQINDELLVAKDLAEENESKFRQLAENIDEVFWLRTDSEMLYISPAFEKVWGIPCNELYKNPLLFTESIHPEDKSAVLEIFGSDAFKKTGLFNYDYRITRPDGKIRWINAKSMPVVDSLGNVIRRAGLARDITDKVIKEQELLKAKENAEVNQKRLQSIFLVAPTGIGVVKNRIIAEVNTTLCHITGYEKEELIGQSARILYPTTEEFDYVGTEKYRQIGEKGTGMVETKWVRKDGNIIDVLLASTPIDQANYGVGVTFTALDITSRKKMENDLLLAKEKAEESDRLKTAFLQNMSHEIRTPMNAIVGFSDLMADNFDNKVKLTEFAGIIKQRSFDLLNIIDDVLDIARIESGLISVNLESCNIAKLFSDLLITFQMQQKINKKQHIGLNYILPAGNIDLFMVTDTQKLKQIFINLLNNAFKFTNSGKIEYGAIAGNHGSFTFYVSDTGVGIPQDKHKDVFNRFYQIAPGESKTNAGNGLGLAIVKGFIDLLGGQIWIEPNSGGGTIFFFNLKNDHAEKVDKKKEASYDEEVSFNFECRKILIVEDDEFNLSLLEKILKKTGAQLMLAITGEEAMEKALGQNPDLILMDIGLPDISGYEVVKQILTNKPTLKIIAQTAYASSEDRTKCLESGCIDYISKPIRSQHLISLVNKYLRS